MLSSSSVCSLAKRLLTIWFTTDSIKRIPFSGGELKHETMAMMIGAYIVMRCLEITLFPANRYSSAGAQRVMGVVAILVAIVTIWMLAWPTRVKTGLSDGLVPQGVTVLYPNLSPR
jgi:hypothetical protein